jgi:hypothetical protein
MVYDVTSATEEVAGSVSSCGNFCSLMQNIAVTGAVLFPDAGKSHAFSCQLICITRYIMQLLSFLWVSDDIFNSILF